MTAKIASTVTWAMLLVVSLSLPCHREASVPAHPPTAQVVEVTVWNSCGWCTTPSGSETRINDLAITGTSFVYTPELSPQMTSTWSTSKPAWQDLQRSIDEPVLRAFDTNTGCPGCADMPTESVEIKFSDGSQRAISYDAGSGPPPIAALAQRVRAAANASALELIKDPSLGGAAGPGPIPDAAATERRAEHFLAFRNWDAPPFTARLKDGVWIVMGTVRCQEVLPQTKKFCYGGSGVRIRATDGKVLQIFPPVQAKLTR